MTVRSTWLGRVTVAMAVLLAIGLLLEFSSNASASNPDTVALFHFEGDTLDSSGNGHHGTSSGGISFVLGIVGQAVRIPNGQYMTFDQPSTGNELTYEAILRFDSFPNAHEAFILRRRGHFQDHQVYAKRIEDPDSPGTYVGYVVFSLAKAGTYPGHTVVSPIPVKTGNWYHIAGTYDGAVMRIYQDQVDTYDPADPTIVAEWAVMFNVGWGANRGSWIGHS